MSLATRKALFTKIKGISGVSALVGDRIYHAQAPPTAAYPLVILNKQAGSPVDAFGDEAFKRETWLVKAVDRNTTSNVAEEISEAIDAALHEGSLSVSGKTLADMRRISDVDYLEPSGDQTFRHHGGNYRLQLT